jgi:hypothetical protein
MHSPLAGVHGTNPDLVEQLKQQSAAERAPGAVRLRQWA